ncbi:MAG: hypothetical protein MHM6MM_000766 [Cercozoa sp. M6MM]
MPFTPLTSLLGGIGIGATTSAHLALNGRITGISGIVNGLRRQWRRIVNVNDLEQQLDVEQPLKEGEEKKETVRERFAKTESPDAWRAAFTLGLVSSGAALGLADPVMFFGGLAQPGSAGVPSLLSMGLGGALVGYGTAMGSGCTSGHGVCGLPRLSMRSLAAVGTFMTTGALTASSIASSESLSALLRTVTPSIDALAFDAWGGGQALALVTAVGLAAKWQYAMTHPNNKETWKSTLSSALVGLGFGGSLGLAGMTDTAKILGFLSPLTDIFDPSLAFVMGGAVSVNYFTFKHLMANKKFPLLKNCKMELPSAKVITPALLLGSALFGVGWGISGVCPGPAMVGIGSGLFPFWVYALSMLSGQYAYDRTLNTLPHAVRTILFLESKDDKNDKAEQTEENDDKKQKDTDATATKITVTAE